MIMKFITGLRLILSHPRLVFSTSCEPPEIEPLEKLILDKVVEQVDSCIAEAIKDQLQQINLIDRYYEPNLVVTFSRISGPTYSLERRRKIPSEKDEYRLTRIDYMINNSPGYVDIYVVFGNLYSLEFSSEVKKNELQSTDVIFI